MKINWSVRFRNKVWLSTFCIFIVGVVYDLLDMFEIVPKIPKDSIVNIIKYIIEIASFVGLVIDPTTKGLSDSERALDYTEPN